MLYEKKLDLYYTEVKNAVDKLFTKAYKCQSHESDLLLIIKHFYFNKDSLIYKQSPYVYGTGDEGLMYNSQNDFFEAFFKMLLIHDGDSEDLKMVKEGNSPLLSKSAIVQIELMVYLKTWESDLFLKMLYNLCRLTHGKNYDWHKKLIDTGRTNLITDNIRNMTKKKVPAFYNLIDSIYSPQIRNAIAHSKYWIASDGIKLFNYDSADPLNTRKDITFNEWEVIIHKTILLYNLLFEYLKTYDKVYKESALGLHYGHQLRIIELDKTIQYDWLRLEDPENVDSPWMWYWTFSKHYLKRFHIVIK